MHLAVLDALDGLHLYPLRMERTEEDVTNMDVVIRLRKNVLFNCIERLTHSTNTRKKSVDLAEVEALQFTNTIQ